MAMQTRDIGPALGILPQGPVNEGIIRYLFTDSRQISFPAESMFIALVTPRRNGHLFIPQAYQKGVRAFLVSETPPLENYPEAVFFQLKNTLDGLQHLAAIHRNAFNLPVIALTGSNGKTIVKEWLAQLLAPEYNICRSPRSYNSQIGVPLSVWQLGPQHQLGIFEAGISAPGEMANLEKIIQPSVGIFTNLGTAHDEGFISKQAKLLEKWKLFKNCKTIICHTDDELVKEMVIRDGEKVISWGVGIDARFRITKMTISGSNTDIEMLEDKVRYHFLLPFIDEASIENGIHCLVTCITLGLNKEVLQQRVNSLHALSMRLEWKKGINQSLLLNDSYSHDLHSLEIALNFLKQQSGHSRQMAILSDLPGQTNDDAYLQVANLLAQKGVFQLIGVGQGLKSHEHFFKQAGIATQWFQQTEQLLTDFDRKTIEKATVLIKGARIFGFERIASALQQQQHETLLEINLSALAQNLNSYKSLLKPGTRIMVMLKAFGYGSADAELGRWLQHQGVDYLAVAYADEGVALRNGGVQLPVMVMNPEPGSFAQLLEYGLEPELFSTEIFNAFAEYLTENDITQYPVHLKLDTGMHRLGFLPEQSDQLIHLLQNNPSLRVSSVFTHLVASENPIHDDFTRLQATNFQQFTDRLEGALDYPFVKHVANTAAIIRHPHLHFDMVRLGIGLFGVNNTANSSLLLHPATRLLTTVAQVKKVFAGQSVGYGREAVLKRDSLIATVRIGYADGYSRRLSNGIGSMRVRNERVPVVGNVCMDMTMLDVTEVPGVQSGDRVEVFGTNISVGNLAKLIGTIPYEIMTGINQRVKRVLIEE